MQQKRKMWIYMQWHERAPQELLLTKETLKTKFIAWKTLLETQWHPKYVSVQFSSVQSLSRVRLCNPMNGSMPSLPVHHHLPEFTQTHIHPVGDAIQPSHTLSSPSPPAFSLSQHQGLSQSVRSSHQVARVLEFQFQHQSFQWIFRNDFL